MADIYVDSAAGNDANAGTIGSPKQTIAGANTGLSNADSIILRGNATHTLTGNVNLNCLHIRGHVGDTRPVIAGNFALVAPLLSKCKAEFLEVTGTAAGAFQSSGSGGDWSLFDVKYNPTANTGNLINDSTGLFSFINGEIYNCLNPIIHTGSSINAISIQDSWIENCSRVVEAGNVDIEGNHFIKCKTVVYLNGAKAQAQPVRIGYNTIDGKDGVSTGNNGYLIETATGSTDYFFPMAKIYRNIIIDCAKMINKLGTGNVAHSGFNCRENWIHSSTDLTDYTGTNDITNETDPLFYNRAGKDYHIEMTSSCAKGIGGRSTSAGANELDSPDTFYSNIPENKVEDDYDYKQQSRTDNKTGTLASGGETDGNKVLNTSTLITGNVVPVALSDVRAGTPAMLGTGTCAVPTASKVKSGVAVDNTTGTLTLPAGSNVLTGSGTYGEDGTEITPSLTPDYPERENVTPDDTVNGQAGTLDLPALNKVAPTDTLRGAAGTLDLPALSSIDPADTLEGAAGTLDLPALSSIDPADTLKGQAGTLDLPALSSVDPADTLKGQAGTLDLPLLKNVATTDTLKGQAGGLVIPPNNKVELDFDYGPDSEETGILNPSGDYPDTQFVLKDIEFDNGNKVGTYDPDKGEASASGIQSYDILKAIEDQLYKVRPSESGKFNSIIKKVEIRKGASPSTIEQEDMPHVQISRDERTYDHRTLAFGGAFPISKMRVVLTVTCSANYTEQDMENLLEDIEETLISGNFSLGGKATSIEIESSTPLQREAGSESEVQQLQLALVVTYVKRINQ